MLVKKVCILSFFTYCSNVFAYDFCVSKDELLKSIELSKLIFENEYKNPSYNNLPLSDFKITKKRLSSFEDASVPSGGVYEYNEKEEVLSIIADDFPDKVGTDSYYICFDYDINSGTYKAKYLSYTIIVSVSLIAVCSVF